MTVLKSSIAKSVLINQSGSFRHVWNIDLLLQTLWMICCKKRPLLPDETAKKDLERCKARRKGSEAVLQGQMRRVREINHATQYLCLI